MILLLNWKSNHTKASIREWFSKIQPNTTEVMLLPPTIYMHICDELIKEYNLNTWTLAAQDVSSFTSGSYTGKINAQQIKDYCNYCLVGHLETIKYDNVNPSMITDKIKNLIDNRIVPIVCVNEKPDSDILELANQKKLVLAYEPKDNISSNTIAEYDKINKFYEKVDKIEFIYGGGVNENNVHLLRNIDYVSGLLIGSASLTPFSINSIIDIMANK